MINITPDFIRAEVENQTYEISLHADDERIADGLTVSQLELVLSDCQIIEHYPDDPRGESCLALGLRLKEYPYMLSVAKIVRDTLFSSPSTSQPCRNGSIPTQETNEEELKP